MTVLTPRQDFTTHYDGEQVELRAGLTFIDDDHEIARQHPDKFEPGENPARRARLARLAQRSQNTEPGAGFDTPNVNRTSDPWTAPDDAEPLLVARTRPDGERARGADARRGARAHGAPARGRRRSASAARALHRRAVAAGLLPRLREVAQRSSVRRPRVDTGGARGRPASSASRALDDARHRHGRRLPRALRAGPQHHHLLDGLRGPDARGLARRHRGREREALCHERWRGVELVQRGGRGLRRLAHARSADDHRAQGDELRTCLIRAVRGQRHRSADRGPVRGREGDHEATAFTTGTGTAPQPKGIITAVSAVGGSVIATATNTLAAADVYTNQNSLPARWRPRAKFMANLGIINGYRQLPKATNVQESLVDDSGPRPKVAGWEVWENNAMDGTLTATAADYALLSGDFQQFAICDRVGTTIEVVPHLFGAARRPTGQRGFLLHWRVGSDVLVADAFRLTNYSG